MVKDVLMEELRRLVNRFVFHNMRLDSNTICDALNGSVITTKEFAAAFKLELEEAISVAEEV